MRTLNFYLIFSIVFFYFSSAHVYRSRSPASSDLFRFHQFDEAPYKLYRRDDEAAVAAASNNLFKPVKKHHLEWAREAALNDAKLFISAYKRWGNGYGMNSKRASRFSPRHLPLF